MLIVMCGWLQAAGRGAACRGLRRGRGGERRAAALDALLALVEDHGEHDHRALDDDLPERRDAEDHEAVGEEADDERADQRARGRSRARRISDVPPMTTAAIALSSNVSPACGAAEVSSEAMISPAIAAQTPEIM